jgi:large conductance mechanosensitive channel
MLKEFKIFIMRGNVIDLAIGVIIGASFSAIVNSLITDVITPLILTPVMNAVHVKDLAQWGVGKDESVKIGKFLAAVINFLLTAFILFIIIKAFNKAKNKMQDSEKTVAPINSNEEKLLTEIRDLLKK